MAEQEKGEKEKDPYANITQYENYSNFLDHYWGREQRPAIITPSPILEQEKEVTTQ